MKKSIFLFFAAILCAMTANAKTVYLKAGLWDVDGAKFGCHTWGSSDKSGFMTHVAGDVYSFETLDANTDVIFTRVSPSSTGIWGEGGAEWGRVQTTFQNGKDMFTMTKYSEGTWGVSDDVLYTFTKNSTLYIDFRAIAGGANYPKAGSVGIDYSANAGGTVIPVTFTADVTWAKGVEFMKTAKGDWASIPFEVPTAGQNCAQVAADGKSYTWTTYSENCQVTVSAENGTVEGAGTYKRGTSVTLTAAPNDGYEFVNWTVGGKEVSTANPYTFTVNDNITLVANFKEAAAKTYTVTTNATNGTVEGAATVVESESVTLTATANPGYTFVNWTVGGVEVSTDNPYTFVPTEDVTVTANFEELPKETIYFVNNKEWSTVNAYVWNEPSGVNNGWPGVAATKTEEKVAGFDVYSFTAAEGQYTHVIFNTDGSQTANLVWTAGKYYWMGAEKDFAGATKEEVESTLATPIPDVWTIVGAEKLMGVHWDLNASANNMQLQQDGSYILTRDDISLAKGDYEYKAVKDHSYNVAIPQNGNQKLTIETAGIYDITFTLKDSKLTTVATLVKAEVIIPTVFVAGKNLNKWSTTANELILSKDSLTASATIALKEGTDSIKMVVGGNWLGNNATMTRENDGQAWTFKADEGNCAIVADIAGNYVFTWNFDKNQLTVTYPELPTYNVTATVNPAETGSVEGAKEYKQGEQATLTATPASGYKFVNWTVDGEQVVTENPYSFEVTKNVTVVANFVKDQGTALDNIVTSEAPIKVIENGQLFVIKNGVKYNVLGAIVK
ncbi:MAG: starch-binding protein [Paludibacteraceae bacterium]|nr:starch-binding protein [Paludibacteraceae bacterium]